MMFKLIRQLGFIFVIKYKLGIAKEGIDFEICEVD